MGIQIVSALANIHSQLITRSGVQLQEQDDLYGRITVLPDPGQYVEEVFSQWSAGHSHRPPTWRHLLEVLRDIGLLELSQQIDTFMKGKDWSECVTANKNYRYRYSSQYLMLHSLVINPCARWLSSSVVHY